MTRSLLPQLTRLGGTYETRNVFRRSSSVDPRKRMSGMGPKLYCAVGRLTKIQAY